MEALSKRSHYEPYTFSEKKNMQSIDLDNGIHAYDEDESSQSIWWESQNGLLARYVYYINGNQAPLGEYKLTQSELIDLVNQVQ